MTAPTAASEAAELGGADQGPRPLMAREFIVLTGFIASLLDDLSSASPDWSTTDTRFETLQRLAMAREQLVRGFGLRLTIAAEMVDEQTEKSHPIGFSSPPP